MSILSKQQEQVIVWLDESAAKTTAEIADALTIRPGAVAAMMASLRERGPILIVGIKGRGSGGPSKQRWKLTEAGRKKRAELLALLKN